MGHCRCADLYEVTCSSEGTWEGVDSCEPLQCSLASLLAATTNTLPNNHTLISVPGAASESVAAGLVSQDTQATFGTPLRVRCVIVRLKLLVYEALSC